MQRDRWQDMSLARQFALAGGAVMLVAMLAVGLWVSRWIEEMVVRNTANATALYMESFIAPLMQDLSTRERMSPDARLEIDRLIEKTALGERVVSFKLWREDGLLVDASNESLVGQRFEVTENLRLAWDGQVRADFEETGDAEDAAEEAMGLPLLEIYSPIREIGSGKIIAVAEFYEVATALKSDLALARGASFAAVAAVMTAIGITLFAIVLRGSRTIDRQLVALEDMARRNVALRRRVQGAAARFSAMNDQALRRIGADLHDGPVQMMSFAALRLDAVRRRVPEGPGRADVDAVEGALKDSITELRNISRGMSLPDLQRRSVPELLQGLAEAQAARVGHPVPVQMDLAGLSDLPDEVKTCLYRVAQEGLTNSWRHGGGESALELVVEDGVLRLSVLDRGPGFPEGRAAPADDDSGGLGLAGLADRVEALGGELKTLNRPGGGAELRMVLDLREVE